MPTGKSTSSRKLENVSSATGPLPDDEDVLDEDVELADDDVLDEDVDEVPTPPEPPPEPPLEQPATDSAVTSVKNA